MPAYATGAPSHVLTYIPTHMPVHNPVPMPSNHLEIYVDSAYENNTELCKSLLFQYASMYPKVADTLQYNYDVVRYNYEIKLHKERTRIINFDHYFKEIDDSINSDQSDLRGSERYEMVWEVSEETSEKIKTITATATGDTSFGTKRSTMETFMKIGEIICLSGDDALGREVRKEVGPSSDLEDAMLAVLEHMTDAEKQAMMACDDGKGKPFLDQMLKLKKLPDEYCVFDDLKDVIAILTNEHSNTETKSESKLAGEEQDYGDSERNVLSGPTTVEQRDN